MSQLVMQNKQDLMVVCTYLMVHRVDHRIIIVVTRLASQHANKTCGFSRGFSFRATAMKLNRRTLLMVVNAPIKYQNI